MTENITIVGNIASEPRTGTGPSGVTYTSFRVACGSRIRDKETGEWTDGATSFYTVTAFKQLAEHAYASLRSGDRIVATGRVRIREWTDGERRGTTAEIEVEALGPELRWGTTTFHRARRGGAEAASEEFPETYPEEVTAAMAMSDAVPTPF